MPGPNGDSDNSILNALRLMGRVRHVPASVRDYLVRERRRRAVARAIAARRQREYDDDEPDRPDSDQ